MTASRPVGAIGDPAAGPRGDAAVVEKPRPAGAWRRLAIAVAVEVIWLGVLLWLATR